VNSSHPVNPDTKHRAKSRLTTYSTLECAADPSTAWSAMAASDYERMQPSDVQPAAELGIRLAEELEKGCISATLAAGCSSGPTGASLPALYGHSSFQQPLPQEPPHSDAACKISWFSSFASTSRGCMMHKSMSMTAVQQAAFQELKHLDPLQSILCSQTECSSRLLQCQQRLQLVCKVKPTTVSSSSCLIAIYHLCCTLRLLQWLIRHNQLLQ